MSLDYVDYLQLLTKPFIITEKNYFYVQMGTF